MRHNIKNDHPTLQCTPTLTMKIYKLDVENQSQDLNKTGYCTITLKNVGKKEKTKIMY